MWSQTLFSKKNRSLAKGLSLLQDEFHILTEKTDEARSFIRSITRKSKAHTFESMCFIEKVDNLVYVGVIGSVGDIIGHAHEYAREAALTSGEGLGRKITFTHSYDRAFGGPLHIPDIDELLRRQFEDLKYALSEAHAGNEPVPMAQVSFPRSRATGTSWDEIASAVEAGTCRGGFFSKEGRLLEEFAIGSETVKKAAEKKTMPDMAVTRPEMASPASLPPAVPKMAETLPAVRKTSPFLIVTGVTVGAALMGWGAWKLMHRRRDQDNEGAIPRSSR